MVIIVEWYNTEETILLETFDTFWTTEDYFHLVDKAAAYLEQKDYLVHIIADFSATRSIPPNAMSGIRYAEKKLPANQGVIIFVAPGTIITLFLRIARQLNLKAAAQIYTADTVQMAYERIQELTLDRQ